MKESEESAVDNMLTSLPSLLKTTEIIKKANKWGFDLENGAQLLDKSFVFFQEEDGIRDYKVTGVQTCALPIYLEKMGIGLDALTIQEISDEEGYLDALGQRRTAEVQRDAEIGKAEALRDSKIKAALAMQEGERVRLASEADIAASTRETEVKRAQFQAEIKREQARSEERRVGKERRGG